MGGWNSASDMRRRRIEYKGICDSAISGQESNGVNWQEKVEIMSKTCRQRVVEVLELYYGHNASNLTDRIACHIVNDIDLQRRVL
jgi:hypothetical protein